jgi:hypothetical protein
MMKLTPDTPDLRRLRSDQRLYGPLRLLLLRTYQLFAYYPAIHQLTSAIQPETAGRSLEEMDDIFHQVSGFKGAFTVVKVAREMPRRYGKHGELLINYEETAEARRVSMRRRSSVAAQDIGGKKYSNGDGEKVEDVESGVIR